MITIRPAAQKSLLRTLHSPLVVVAAHRAGLLWCFGCRQLGVVLEPHNATATDVQQVADLQDE
jgi:hypothetical protein